MLPFSAARARCLAVLFGSMLVGCGIRPPAVVPDSGLTSLNAARREAAAAELYQRCAELRSLRGMYSLELRSGLQSAVLTQVIAFQLPDLLRLELFATNLQRLTALVIVNQDQLYAFDAGTGTVYFGAPGPAQMEQLVRLPLSPPELMLWLGGCVSEELGESSYGGYSRRSGKTVLEFRAEGERTLRLLLNSTAKGTGVLEALELYQDDERLLSSKFSYPEGASAAFTLPETITFWLKEEQLEGVLTRQEVVLNPIFERRDARLFEPRIPPGATVLELEGPDELPALLDSVGDGSPSP